MQHIAKSARLDLRLSPMVKDLVQRAARIENKTISDFIADRIQKAAEQVLLDQRVFAMNDADFQHFTTALNKEDTANNKLNALFARRPVAISDQFPLSNQAAIKTI